MKILDLKGKCKIIIRMKFSSQKRENAKRENGFRVFNFIFKFQKIEFKNCYFMKFMKLKREFIKIWNENAKTKTNKQKVKLI